ncbi:MAG TPA: DUF882 domain-containing protein [Polyangia bacterium]|nr:DUF882 domain-containing protein [Polyangia bacterium]
MAPLLSIALALIQNVADLGRVFVAPSHEPPAITFYFQNRHEETSLALLDEHDAVKPDALKELSHFVRCWRTQREKPMHPRLVEIVAALSRHFGDARIEVVSGYRARPYGAPHSKHFLGRAMDIHLNGIPAKVAARWVWANFRKVGVGFYPKQDFMHVDVRDQDVRWVDTSRHGESAHARYFGRPVGEELPEGAPKLAYDTAAAAAQPAPTAVAMAELPWRN